MSDVSAMRAAMAIAIMTQVEDPARWLRGLRVVTERLKLAPARCLPIGADVTLEIACFKVLEEAEKHRIAAHQVLDALRDIGT